MKIAVFNTQPYDETSFRHANRSFGHELVFLESRLSRETAALAAGYPAVCVFVNDVATREVLSALRAGGTRIVLLRSAGFNNVDVAAAEDLGMVVARVPAYSPHAVAEHAIALLLCLNRKIHRAYARVRDGNFELAGLVGFELSGRTAGVVGTGKIGSVTARILHGFGCRLVAYDPYPDDALAKSLPLEYRPYEALLEVSDIVTLHLPLTPATRYLVNDAAIARMKRGAVLLNTSRGGLVDTGALIRGLKSGRIGGAALDVYEREAGIFFEDFSQRVLEDDELARLLTLPNVLVTGHQAFLTDTALANIAETTLENAQLCEAGAPCRNLVTPALAAPPRV